MDPLPVQASCGARFKSCSVFFNFELARSTSKKAIRVGNGIDLVFWPRSSNVLLHATSVSAKLTIAETFVVCRLS